MILFTIVFYVAIDSALSKSPVICPSQESVAHNSNRFLSEDDFQEKACVNICGDGVCGFKEYGCPLDCGPENYRVFVTTQVFDGHIGGVDKADAFCNAAAFEENLGGRWKAWISQPGRYPANKDNGFYRSEVPYKLLDNQNSEGAVIASKWNDLTDGNLQNPINRFENGVQLPPPPVTRHVWSSTSVGGYLEDDRHCDGWTIGAYDEWEGFTGMTGRAISSDSTWTRLSPYPCAIWRSLYCFEQPVSNSCGDGILHEQYGEECDDGDLENTDACTNVCEFNVCGDGIVNSGVEQCDDGNSENYDGCNNKCLLN